ncbi:deoxyguanosinetriphosphate triphosphohydrolase [Pikeienuella piscinae]|uniref:Deoxyguanosinetriphosphate triphosphohydrolase-like protein n=2 Tax=Pikeienuella piscinae TaxID=2748098 RepID=A0A7M3T7J6_9RHOB|nr:deoxyguanosinetriphosphate triphosphohydrolase [Pikeienuella piscinae]
MNRQPLAPYATDAACSRGRLHAEPESAHRSPFQRDRDRIIHSSAFRRLKHKTQVFVEHEGDHYRTRLTHSLEVAQIARTCARTLGADEDLAEAVALAHDLGHTPFGHTGEEALHGAMRAHGGFDHNAQTLKIVTDLERRYAEFDGLNLTWEVLEGIAKHNGPLLASAGDDPSTLHFALAEYDARFDLELWTHAGLEAQIAALSDDIAYNTHDLDDGLRAGLFGLGDLADLPLAGPALAEVRARYPGLDAQRTAHETFRRVFGAMVEDVLTETRARLDAAAPESAEALRALPVQMAAFSEALDGDLKIVREFLFARMYRHPEVLRMRRKTARVVRDLFAIFVEEPALLPDDWRDAAVHAVSADIRARVVADYIAGMTDRFALDEHRNLTDATARV